MWESVIAVTGTLLGVLVTAAVQQRAARSERAEQRGEQRQRDRLAAMTALATAIADHRRAMYVREAARLDGEPPERVAAARAESHQTRSAITAPLLALQVTAPEIKGVAEHAAKAAYAMRNAESLTDLDRSRDSALAAADRLVAAFASIYQGR